MNASVKPTLVFIYNAESGLFHGLTDLAHKIFSPQTYQCNLCAITYSTLGMREEWKRFLDDLNFAYEFLHADELRERYGIREIALPAIMRKEGKDLQPWISADEINRCRTMDDLRALIESKLATS